MTVTDNLYQFDACYVYDARDIIKELNCLHFPAYLISELSRQDCTGKADVNTGYVAIISRILHLVLPCKFITDLTYNC